jgi:hypothetical protein
MSLYGSELDGGVVAFFCPHLPYRQESMVCCCQGKSMVADVNSCERAQGGSLQQAVTS